MVKESRFKEHIVGIKQKGVLAALKQKDDALRESQAKNKQIAEKLEKLVVERTKDLDEANRKLLRTNAELEQFAFIASHDMQEPLRKIKIFTSRLEDKVKDFLDNESVMYLDKIKHSSERMTRLINDILNYSRLINLDEQFERTNLNETLKEVLDDFELSMEQNKLVIKSESLPVVNAIPLQMNQLFHNVISNSLKFCQDEHPCELTISCRILSPAQIAERRLNAGMPYIEIIFKDNGIGFKQEFAENIFKIFERLHGRDKYEGTGIGLALCRKIVNIHHGDIFAVSAENNGTEMHVILPVG
jgi:two-component system CheB/CheR fusion protein